MPTCQCTIYSRASCSAIHIACRVPMPVPLTGYFMGDFVDCMHWCTSVDVVVYANTLGVPNSHCACCVAGPLDNFSLLSWSLIIGACTGHEGTLRMLLGGNRLQQLFEKTVEEVLKLSDPGDDGPPVLDTVRVPLCNAMCRAVPCAARIVAGIKVGKQSC
jgi:hypothetical protein